MKTTHTYRIQLRVPGTKLWANAGPIFDTIDQAYDHLALWLVIDLKLLESQIIHTMTKSEHLVTVIPDTEYSLDFYERIDQ